MTTIEKVKAIASENGTKPYVFGSMAQVNKMMDKIHRQNVFPIAISIQPVDGTLSISESYLTMGKDTSHLMVGYADSIKLDYDAEQVQTKVETLKQKCLTLLHKLSTDGFFEWISEATYSVMFDALDANMVIVLMDFTAKEAEGVCLD